MHSHISTSVVPFHGAELLAVQTADGHYTPLKPYCELLGLSWPRQFRKVKERETLYGVAIMAIPTSSGEQEMVCIPVNRLAMWLASISPNKVNPDLRELLEAFQKEAADVLDRHFRLKHDVMTKELSELQANLEHCHLHLLLTNPKWARIEALSRVGSSEYMMAKYCKWTQLEVAEAQQMMRQCGFPLTSDMPQTLADRERNARSAAIVAAGQQSELFARES